MKAEAKNSIKDFFLTFLKGIVVGLGAIAPGLSGSLLLIIFGLYRKIVDTVSHIFKDFKRNVLFLAPLVLGIGVGVILFAKLIDPLEENWPVETHYAFLGLVIGAFPALLREVRKEGFAPRYYAFMSVSFAVGAVFLWFFGAELVGDTTDTGFFKCVLLGLAVSCAYLIPGVDSCAILSTFGLYSLWTSSLADFNMRVLLPAAIGLLIGGVVISIIFNKLLAKFYTGTYSIVFGLFVAVVLNFIYRGIYTDGHTLASDGVSPISVLLLVLGLVFSFAFSMLDKITALLKRNKLPEAEGEDTASAGPEGGESSDQP